MPLNQVDRLNKKELGGGTILDLGIYTLQFQQYIFRGLTPIKVVANGQLNEDGVDKFAAAIITYEQDKMAVVSCSAVVQNSCEGNLPLFSFNFMYMYIFNLSTVT